MSVIGFYISSHGFGHLTRSLVIIEKLLNETSTGIYIASGTKQIDFAKDYLIKYSGRVHFNELITDIGLINNQKSLSINRKALEESLSNFIKTWNGLVDIEVNNLSNFNIKKIMTDISPIGALVANRLNVKCYAISNFTWVEIYDSLQIDNEIIKEFINAYDFIDEFFEYKLRLPSIYKFGKIISVGFVSREISHSRVREIKEVCGDYVLITTGQSADLNQIRVDNYKGKIIGFHGVDISSPNVSIISLETIDTHNYIAASKLVIGKAGWGIIAESLISGVPLVLVERPDAYEDSYMIDELKKQRLAISIDEKDLTSLDIDKIYTKAMKYIDFNKLKKIKNDINTILDTLNVKC